MSGAEYTHYNPLIFVVMHVCDDLTWCCKYGTSTLSRRDWMIYICDFNWNAQLHWHTIFLLETRPFLWSDFLSLSLSFIHCTITALSLTHFFLLSALRLNHSALLFRSSREGNNEPAFLHSFIHPTSLYLSVNTHGNLERTFYKKTPIMGCHFFDVHVNTSYNVIPTYFSY